MKPGVQVFVSADDLARAAATKFVESAAAAVGEKGLFSVALAGGSTPKTLYELMADPDEPFRSQMPWTSTHFFWTDERHVSPDHPQSNYRMAHESMLARIPVREENVHRIQGELQDAVEAAQKYENQLKEFFQVSSRELPRFDLVFLGLGEDGHTSSIFPGSDVLHERSRLVAARWVEKLASFRITLTPIVLNDAASIIFLVSGEGKAEVLRDVLEGDADPDRLPAQILDPTDGSVVWFVDQQAARLLERTVSRG